jgi:hypothetical protein
MPAWMGSIMAPKAMIVTAEAAVKQTIVADLTGWAVEVLG